MILFKKRSLLKTTLLTFCTLGLYDLYYLIVTRRELNQAGGRVPTPWLLLVPFLNLYFISAYARSYAIVVKQDRSIHIILLWFVCFLIVFSPFLVGRLIGFNQMLFYYLVKGYYVLVKNFNDADMAIISFTKLYTMTEVISKTLVVDMVIAIKIAILQNGYNKYQ